MLAGDAVSLATALLVILVLQCGIGPKRLKACLDALGVNPSEYAEVDLPALMKAFGGEDT